MREVIEVIEAMEAMAICSQKMMWTNVMVLAGDEIEKILRSRRTKIVLIKFHVSPPKIKTSVYMQIYKIKLTSHAEQK